jgi:hypothetical protein
MKKFLLLWACSCAPTRTVTVEDIPKLAKLEILMDAQATYADPQFKKMKADALSDADFAQMVDAAKHLVATAKKLPDFSKGPEMTALAGKLGEKAAALETAATAKDKAGAQAALTEMKATCKECHSKFK